MITLSYPLNMQVELTESCNHKCFYCYNSWQLNKDGMAFMTAEKADMLADIIRDDIKSFQVTLTGGEPLLNMPALLKFSKKFSDDGIYFNINTNLTLFNKNRLEQVLTNSQNFGILTSLPHFKREQYEFITQSNNFDSFFLNLRNISNRDNIPVMVNMVVNKKTLTDVYSEAEFLYKNYNIYNFAATPMVLPANVTSNLEDCALSNEDIIFLFQTLIDLNKDFGIKVDSLETVPRCFLPEEIRNNKLRIFSRSCSAGRTTITVDYEGNVRGCSHDPNKYGNVFEKSFSDIWLNLEDFRRNKLVPEECLPCEELLLCNGGCRFYNYSPGDSLNKKDPRMTVPLKNISPIIKTPLILDEGIKYSINPLTSFRKEKDNIYTFFNGSFSNVLFVNNDFKDFICVLKKIGSVNFKELLDVYGEENKNYLKGLLNTLLNKNFLIS